MTYNWHGHDIYLALLVIERATLIRNESGYGSITIDFRHGTMVSCKSTVRDHPPKSLTQVGQDSHDRSAEVEESTERSVLN